MIIAKGEVSPTHLEIAPNLEILQRVDPGRGERTASIGKSFFPLPLVGLELDHQDEVDRKTDIDSLLDHLVKHFLTLALGKLVVAID